MQIAKTPCSNCGSTGWIENSKRQIVRGCCLENGDHVVTLIDDETPTHIAINITEEHLGTEATAGQTAGVIMFLHETLSREFPGALVTVNARPGRFVQVFPEEAYDRVRAATERLIDEALDTRGVPQRIEVDEVDEVDAYGNDVVCGSNGSPGSWQ